jgi:hypothetical protein
MVLPRTFVFVLVAELAGNASCVRESRNGDARLAQTGGRRISRGAPAPSGERGA